jgi:hypothetical protein
MFPVCTEGGLINDTILKLYSPNFIAAVKQCEEIRSGKTDSLWPFT